MYQLGIDTGGTFTDFVLLDEKTGNLTTYKEISTPEDPSIAILHGIKTAQKQHGVEPSRISRIVYGTTVATNAVLEHKGAKTGLLTTRGFRDVLEIRRQWRPKLFDLYYSKPTPLVPRYLRLEVNERVGATGDVLEGPDPEGVVQHLDFMVQDGVEALAVAFLFSFANPDHENKIKALVEERYPELFVCISSEICPEFREYERTATTVLNAYLMPIMTRYLKRLRTRLHGVGITKPLRIMQSNGGITRSEEIEKAPVSSLLSGPVGGVVGGVKLTSSPGLANIITIDMGGTSTDISLIQNGELELIPESEISNHPVKIPQVNIHTIGAGGGSVVTIFGGGLKVGPQSAGADPGPICYGRGGTLPTSTDAAMQLGFLDKDYFLGGTMTLDDRLSRRIFDKEVARPLGMNVEEAAYAVLFIQSLNIEHGIRAVSLEKGYDPREYTLVAFGGASGLLVGMVAGQLSIPTVLMPRHNGVFSALGLLMADLRRTRSLTKIMPLQGSDLAEIKAIFAGLERDLRQSLAAEDLPQESIVLHSSCDMRYIGQAYEINVPMPEPFRTIEARSIEGLLEQFHRDHRKRFGHAAAEEPVEFVCFRVVAGVPVKKISFPPMSTPNKTASLKGYRRVYFGKETGFVNCPIHAREDLKENVVGPVIIEAPDTTIVVFPGQTAEVDAYGNIVLHTKA
jgi:N-methylhydantoinase A